MSDSATAEDRLKDEFRSFGKNLVDVLHAAWESPERRKLQQEISSSLVELGAMLHEETTTFVESPTGQKLKSDLQDLGERLRSGEANDRIRQELLNALQTANAELERLINRWQSDESSGSSSPSSGSKGG